MDEQTQALLRLLDEYGVRLHVLLARMTLRHDVADELLQELFLKLQGGSGLSEAKQPEQYLFRSAINLAFDWRRRERRSAGNVPLAGNETNSEPSLLDQAIRREELERVMRELESLPGSDRELLVMRFLNGNSYDELADQLGSTPHRVRAQCASAVARLRKRLDVAPA